jgi:serine protease inhibitor
MSSGHSHITTKLLSAIERTNGSDNVLFSPLSAEILFTIALAGTTGKVRQEILALLGITEAEVPAHRKNISAQVRSLLTEVGEVQVECFNGLWYAEVLNMFARFLDQAKADFALESSVVHFSDDATLEAIEQIATKKTNGLIKDLGLKDMLSQEGAGGAHLDPAFVLMNCLYFKGRWDQVLDPHPFKTDKFTLPDGKEIETEFMSYLNEYGSYCTLEYMQGENFGALRMPFQSEGLCFEVYLPDQLDGLPTLLKELDNGLLGDYSASFEEVERISLLLPKFELETTLKFSDMTDQLGLDNLFGLSNDFSAMFENEAPIKVTEVMQKNVIKVNEKGVEAATVTIMAAAGGSAGSVGPMLFFEATHPFLFVLRDLKSNAVLYLGTLTHPTEVKGTRNKDTVTPERVAQAKADHRKVMSFINPFWEMSGRSIVAASLRCIHSILAHYEWDHRMLKLILDHVSDFATGTLDPKVNLEHAYAFVDEQTGFGPREGASILTMPESKLLKRALESQPEIDAAIDALLYVAAECAQGRTLEYAFRSFMHLLHVFPEQHITLPNLEPFQQFNQLTNDLIGEPLPQELLSST